MMRRDLLRSSAVALALAFAAPMQGCDREAKHTAELAKGNLAQAETILKEKHVDALAEALPKAAEAISGASDRVAAFTKLRDKTEALRSAKRSYFAMTDAKGVVTWVEDPDWHIVERRLEGGFPAVADVLAGKKPYAAGAGRFGDDGPDALTFVEAAPLKTDGKIDGALVAGWDAREAAADLQRQLSTSEKMQIAAPKRRVKDADRLQLALDTPQIWVGIFAEGGPLYLPYGVPQPIEDAMQAQARATRPVAVTDVVKVMNAKWGVASQREDAILPGYGLMVLRNK